MKYDKNRSLSFNLTNLNGKGDERFTILNASKISKVTPHKTARGANAYDVILGKDGDTIAIVSLMRNSTTIPLIREGEVVESGERKVNDFMVASHSLSELGTTFDNVVAEGINAEWIAPNAMYFNSDDTPDARVKALQCLVRDMWVGV